MQGDYAYGAWGLVITMVAISLFLIFRFLPMRTSMHILEESERVGVDTDYSCRVGMCGVCVVKLLSGQVSMEVEDGLKPEDKESGMILACQATSTGDLEVEA